MRVRLKLRVEQIDVMRERLRTHMEKRGARVGTELTPTNYRRILITIGLDLRRFFCFRRLLICTVKARPVGPR